MKNNNLAVGEYAAEKATEINNCTFIGHNAGADILEGDGLVIIGDDIRSLDPSKHTDTIFFLDKVAIGKTVLGKPCNLYDILKDTLEEHRADEFTNWLNSLKVIDEIDK